MGQLTIPVSPRHPPLPVSLSLPPLSPPIPAYIRCPTLSPKTRRRTVALGGVKSLSIYDPGAVELADLGAQFFLREADVGKNRADATMPRLAELNS